MTLKPAALSVVMTSFWAPAGAATRLAVAMHDVSNDAMRLGGLVDAATWQAAAVSELDLAAPLVVLAATLAWWARRTGWGPRPSTAAVRAVGGSSRCANACPPPAVIVAYESGVVTPGGPP